MTNKRNTKLAGIVVHARSFGEAHRVYELLTADEGRVAAVARNVRVSRRRFAGLDLFATAELELVVGSGGSGGGLWTLQEARVTSLRLGIRDSLARLERASVVCESARLLVQEHERAPAAYAALTLALDRLDAGDLSGAVSFYPTLLAAAGIAPQLSRCVRCGRPAGERVTLDPRLGGAVCDVCSSTGRPLPPQALKSFAGEPCSDPEVAMAVEACAVAWIEAQVGRPLRAVAALTGHGRPATA